MVATQLPASASGRATGKGLVGGMAERLPREAQLAAEGFVLGPQVGERRDQLLGIPHEVAPGPGAPPLRVEQPAGPVALGAGLPGGGLCRRCSMPGIVEALLGLGEPLAHPVELVARPAGSLLGVAGAGVRDLRGGPRRERVGQLVGLALSVRPLPRRLRIPLPGPAG